MIVNGSPEVDGLSTEIGLRPVLTAASRIGSFLLESMGPAIEILESHLLPNNIENMAWFL